ncbi:MAG TPA: RHS repeat-associated core domain-containing protein [Fimbriimonadaceae bacterium]|nr:RHS repeat-associated core domain-containing protein [Fimbriimonadaceae bacterium]HRJ33642.1 RHS repeat-associated core domain-containing protein [Fimbriimonadaceae bacterium]
MTTAPGGGTRTYDLLGNTLTRNGENYAWDNFGRLSGIAAGEVSRSYWYRPDGLRILRVIDPQTASLYDDVSIWIDPAAINPEDPPTLSDPTYRYFYDGQNVHEDDYARMVNPASSAPIRLHTINRYGLGARGIDWFQREDRQANTWATTFPVYDGHGNNLASLTRSGTNGYAISGLRFYDAWGAPRSGAHDSDTRYCASIGHRTDDESGLIYMRARYYEAGSGRFISEDPAIDGGNWYAYCGNNPINAVDPSGKFLELLLTSFLDEMLSAGNASATQAAKHWSKEKILDIMARKLGEALGAMWGPDFMSAVSCAQTDPNGYLWIGNDKGQRIGVDFGDYGTSKHGGPHLDIYDQYVQKLGKRRMELFWDGFMDGLGLP